MELPCFLLCPFSMTSSFPAKFELKIPLLVARRGRLCRTKRLRRVQPSCQSVPAVTVLASECRQIADAAHHTEQSHCINANARGPEAAHVAFRVHHRWPGLRVRLAASPGPARGAARGCGSDSDLSDESDDRNLFHAVAQVMPAGRVTQTVTLEIGSFRGSPTRSQS